MDGGLEEWAGARAPARARGRACRGSLGRCCWPALLALLVPASAAAAPGASSSRRRASPRRSTWPRRRATPRRAVRGRARRARSRWCATARAVGTPFLDISGDVDQAGERGLLSIAFAPDYATSRAVLRLHWSRAARRARSRSREYQRSAAEPDARRPDAGGSSAAATHTERVEPQRRPARSSGPTATCGSRTGDGGGGNDPHNNAQDLASPLGKVLRIDPRAGQRRRYAIPAGNPFGTAVWAYGLRNPFRFSFDRGTGDLRDRRRRPGRARGGRLRAPRAGGSGAAATTAGPAARARSPGRQTLHASAPTTSRRSSTTHSAAGTRAITGGYVVRDPGLPTLLGRYLYADSCDGDVRSLVASRAADATTAGRACAAQHARLVRRGRVRARLRGVARPRHASSGSRTARPAPACSSRRRRRCPRRGAAAPGGGGPAGVRPHRAARADPGRAQGPRRAAARGRGSRSPRRGLPRDDPRPPRRLDARPRRAPRSAPAAARSSGSARRRRRSSASAARSAATSASRCACR